MSRMSFMGPSQDEVVAVTTDLVERFGVFAHDEALHLAEVAAKMRSRRNRNLYRRAAREIEKGFFEAQFRLTVESGSEVVGPK